MSDNDLVRATQLALGAASPSTGLPWLAEARARAVRWLTTAGFPGRRDEAWKYTRPRSLLDVPTPLAGVEGPLAVPERGDPAARLVWVDGVFDREHSRWPDAVEIGAIVPNGSVEPSGFDALNLTYAQDPVRIDFRGAAPPLALVHLATDGVEVSAVRLQVGVAPGVQAELHQHHVRAGAGGSLVTSVLDVDVGDDGSLSLLRLADDGVTSRHYGAVRVEVAERGRFTCTVATMSAGVARVELSVRLAGAGAQATVSGLSLVRGGGHVDHHVTVDHAAPSATSRQRFRALLGGTSDERRPPESVFTGRVIVREGADGTDADQVHRALLLSDHGIVNARPQLEIHADDVKCSHGAAVGSLDEEALFYLRQRGLDPPAARALLTEAFAAEIVADMPPTESPRLVERIRTFLEHG